MRTTANAHLHLIDMIIFNLYLGTDGFAWRCKTPQLQDRGRLGMRNATINAFY